ncbi:MAG: hypothetical protein ABI893_16940 [Polaromonas sp.]|uniref:hypothetical protein n=1 Tax=Polaromonas sp. TaxID=1869339 RepID=UPI0032659002
MTIFHATARVLSCLLAAMALTACAVKSFTSTAMETAQTPIRILDVYWSPKLPANYKLTKSAQGYKPMITDADRKVAADSLVALSRTFDGGFRTLFSEKMKASGVKTVEVISVPQQRLPNPVEGRYQLFIDVEDMAVGCNGLGCVATFDIKGMLRAPASSAPAMTFTTKVGQPIVGAKIDDMLFSSFANALADDLSTKGFLKR